MPLIVTVTLLSGEAQQCRMHGHAAARDLKASLCQRLGVKMSCLHLVTESGQLVQEEVSLLELVASWFALADVLDPTVLKNVGIELTLAALVNGCVCLVCAAPCLKKCARCRRARHCSRACQLQDWQAHKMLCGAQ